MATEIGALQTRIQEDMKNALRSKDKARLGVIRLILAAIKQREVDDRLILDEAQIVAILDKMTKQRKDSISQFESASRQDLADKEKFEITIIQEYLPEAANEDEIETLIAKAIGETGANSGKDMGKVMNLLKPQLQGRCDMSEVSKKVKAKLMT